jgi:hypothetical protein
MNAIRRVSSVTISLPALLQVPHLTMPLEMEAFRQSPDIMVGSLIFV